MNHIIWLASYPKSGNTWFRIFLHNLKRNGHTPVNINDLSDFIASSRIVFDEIAGVESSGLTKEEIENLRPKVYNFLSSKATETLYIKVHDAFIFTRKRESLIPFEATKGSIYFLRNPLDVAVSLAHHNGADIDATIAHMSNTKSTLFFSEKGLPIQLPQKLLSWSEHVLSWVDKPSFQVLVLRYEDMKMRTLSTFNEAAQFLGISEDIKNIERSLKFSDFKRLRHQEEMYSFKERSERSGSFFRKGIIGSWRSVLNEKQVIQIIQDHKAVMQRFGYLSNNGEPVF